MMFLQNSFLLIFLTTFASPQRLSFPAADYHHEIVYTNDDFPEILPLSAAAEISADVSFDQAGNLFQAPALQSVNLFTPNTVQQPAETPGQAENYRKALEEEAREAEKAQNAITGRFFNENGSLRGGNPGLRGGVRGGGAKIYVSVRMGEGAKGYDYRYQV